LVLFTGGFIYANNLEFEKAVGFYDKALSKDPENWQYRLFRAFSLIKTGNLQKAREDALFAVAKQPGLITGYLALAEIEWGFHNSRASIDAYNKAIEMDKTYKPTDIYSKYMHRENPRLGRAIVYWDLREYDRALADLDDVINSNDNKKSIAWLYKSLIYKDMGNMDKAIENAKKWESSPKEDTEHWNPPDFILSEAECYVILKKYDEALVLLNDSVKNNPESLGERGLLYEKLGKPKEAIADFEKFVKKCPDNPFRKEAEQKIRSLKVKL
jgi:tetratricopeptide (TPR) repeat protein